MIAVGKITESVEGSERVEFLNYATSKTKEAAQPGRLLGESSFWKEDLARSA
jgi:hypothetical protein